MNRAKRWLAMAFLALGFLVPGAVAQQSLDKPLTADSLTEAPDTGVVDESKVLHRESASYRKIVNELRKLREERGFKIYVVVEPVLISTTAPELATRLREKWLPEGDGLVVVFESDSRNLGISQDLTARDDPEKDADKVPAYETSAAITRAGKGMDIKLPAEPFLETLVTRLTAEFENYYKTREAPPPQGRGLRLGMLILGTLALLGLIAIGLGSLIRHSSMATARRFRFPVVDRPERLGAPCGGSVTARKF